MRFPTSEMSPRCRVGAGEVWEVCRVSVAGRDEGEVWNDADLALGYLDPAFFLGGTMALDVDAARAAIAEEIASPLGIHPVEAAFGIHRLVNENMASAARIHAVERGTEADRLPLFAFGGAGGARSPPSADITAAKATTPGPPAGCTFLPV